MWQRPVRPIAGDQTAQLRWQPQTVQHLAHSQAQVMDLSHQHLRRSTTDAQNRAQICREAHHKVGNQEEDEKRNGYICVSEERRTLDWNIAEDALKRKHSLGGSSCERTCWKLILTPIWWQMDNRTCKWSLIWLMAVLVGWWKVKICESNENVFISHYHFF